MGSPMSGRRGATQGGWPRVRKIAGFCAPGLFYLADHYSLRLVHATGIRPVSTSVSDRLYLAALVAVVASPFFTLAAAATAIQGHRERRLRGVPAVLAWAAVAVAAYAFIHFLQYVLFLGARWY